MTIQSVIDQLPKSIFFCRTSNGYTISMVGYKHMDLVDTATRIMLKAGFRYDFSQKEIEEWDPVCGRTFVHFVLPNGVAK